MTITEDKRNQLYNRLIQVLGREEATTFMEHMPPVGWADVATKRDLDAHAAMTKRDLDAHAAMTKRDLDAHAAMTKRDLDALEQRIDGRIDTLEARIDAKLERALRQQTNRYFVGMGAMLTILVTAQGVIERL